jgi:hypothetical protein
MCKIPTLQIPTAGYIKQGDTISKKVITFGGDYDGDLTTATIKMQVYNGSQRVIDISNGNGITVISSTVCEIDEVPASENNLPYDVALLGDLEVTEADGVKTTYFNVQYNIIRQHTKP